jgi:ABC-type oligopeptide transport system ATPase subunit
MLEARNLRKSYTAESGRVDAVRDISFGLKAGQFLAVVGRSGSGKSTLLAMLGGLCRPTSGEVRPRIVARVGRIDRSTGEYLRGSTRCYTSVTCSRSHPEPFVQSVRITVHEPTASDPRSPLEHHTR